MPANITPRLSILLRLPEHVKKRQWGEGWIVYQMRVVDYLISMEVSELEAKKLSSLQVERLRIIEASTSSEPQRGIVLHYDNARAESDVKWVMNDNESNHYTPTACSVIWVSDTAIKRSSRRDLEKYNYRRCTLNVWRYDDKYWICSVTCLEDEEEHILLRIGYRNKHIALKELIEALNVR